jgi:hypothetical protein
MPAGMLTAGVMDAALMSSLCASAGLRLEYVQCTPVLAVVCPTLSLSIVLLTYTVEQYTGLVITGV